MTKKKNSINGVDLTNLILQSQAAKLLGITRAGVSWLVASGRLRSEEILGRKFVYKDEVQAYSETRAQRPAKKSSKKGAKK